MLQKLKLLYHTLKYVRFEQMYYQVYYRVKKKFKPASKILAVPKSTVLNWESHMHLPISWSGGHSFTFLNLQKSFLKIDWNFTQYGKLWTYNLSYFDFLRQPNLTKEEGLHLIYDFLGNESFLKDALEPYPISLRGINWIQFLTVNKIQDPKINAGLYKHYGILASNLEYHLMANHLLENGFSLLFGAYYFEHETLYKKAKGILVKELPEQFLSDGAHYELSPMYHQILLLRLLDSYQLVSRNPWKDDLTDLLKITAEKALGWLQEISFRNGEIPMLNDSAPGIAPTTHELLKYGERLGLLPQKITLFDCGYRKFASGGFEMILDAGQISPSYQPGHSHADNLQFVLNHNNAPIIVDSGISTYEKNDRRQAERSTNAHNTVTINNLNSSKVWSGFRVAQRAKTVLLHDAQDCLEAKHDGYRELGITHIRKFEMQDGIFKVTDTLEGNKSRSSVNMGHLHFHPSVRLKINEDTIYLDDELEIVFTGVKSLEILNYEFAVNFNNLIASKKVIYFFENSMYFTLSYQP